MLTSLHMDTYWRTVEATLVEIFEEDAAEAYEKTIALRLRVEARTLKNGSQTFYNTEEYDIARELAGIDNNTLWDSHKAIYFAIKQRFERIFMNPELTKGLERLA